MPASLRIDPWQKEPDTRSGEAPEALRGTVTATGLTVGARYAWYRWDSPEAVGDYDEANQTALEEKLSSDLGLDSADVNLTVSAGSVVLRFLIGTEGHDDAQQIAIAADAAYGDASAASALLEIGRAHV